MSKITFTLASLLLTSIASRADVLTVDALGAGDFADVQPAIHAALDGDVITIRSGSYSGFAIAAKELTLVAEEGAAVEICGSVSIRNLAPSRFVVLRGLEIHGSYSSATPTDDHGQAIDVNNSSGTIVIEDCSLTGDDFVVGAHAAGFEGLWVRSGKTQTIVVGSTLSGGRGLSFGGAGLRSTPPSFSGSMTVYASTTTGGEGIAIGGEGGQGALVADPRTRFLDSEIRGGAGAPSPGPCVDGGDGGDGIVVIGSNTPDLTGTIYDFGLGGGPPCYCPMGTAFVSFCSGSNGVASIGSIANHIFETPARLSTDSFVQEGDLLGATATRLPGDDVWIVTASAPDVSPTSSATGVPLVDQATMLVAPEWHQLGMLDATGTLTGTIPLPVEAGPNVARTVFVQSVHFEPGGPTHYGPLRTVIVRRDPVGTPICDGDGGDPPGCTDCPCGNDTSPGTRAGCLNGAGTACRLTATGTPSMSADTLRFDVQGANANTSCRLASADNALPNQGVCAPGSGIQSTVLDGLRCIGGDLRRHGVRVTGTDGSNVNPWGPPSPNPPGGIIAQGGFIAGQTRRFQAFYREDNLLVCNTGQNTSNAVEITFLP